MTTALGALAALMLGCTADQPPVGPGSVDPFMDADFTLLTCQTSGNPWLNTAFPAQSGTFTVQFDATPGGSGIDGVVGLSPGAAAAYTDVAVIVRFNSSGRIDARNGGTYTAVQAVPYTAGTSYRVRFVVNVVGHTYSVYVTPAGGTEVAIGTDYAFRTEQSGATSLANWAARTSAGTMALCNFSVTGGTAPPPPTPVATVSVSPASVSVEAGKTTQLSVVLRDTAGNVLTGRTITWSSSSTGIATVSGSGLVSGVAAGVATITATSEGKSGTAAVTVTAPVVPPPPAGCAPTGSGVCRYVDAVAGNDANPGTSSQPYRTLQKAAGVVNPGDVVIVRDGTYTGGSTILSITRSGTAANPIVFRADRKWGAIIDGRNNSSVAGIKVAAAYIRVEGFEVRWTSRYGIDAYSGSGATHHVTVAQNRVHHIGRICTNESGGRAGVDAYAPEVVIEQNVIHDIGRLGPGENGCNPGNNYWMNHDHGVYHGRGDNVVIRNNIFYNLTHGWAIHRYGASVSGLTIVNNTFAFPNPNRDGHIIVAAGTSGLTIQNNVFYQPRGAGIWFSTGSAGAVVANNLSYGAAISTGSTSGITSVGNLANVDPRFVSASGLNFRLQSGSPAIDAGLLVSLVTNDVDGLARPQGARHDIGAYEYR